MEPAPHVALVSCVCCSCREVSPARTVGYTRIYSQTSWRLRSICWTWWRMNESMSDRERKIHKLKTKTLLKNYLLRNILSPPSTYFSWPRVVKPNLAAAAVKELLFTSRFCGAKCEGLLLWPEQRMGRYAGWGNHLPAVQQVTQTPGREQGPPWLPDALCRTSQKQHAGQGPSLCPAAALRLYNTVSSPWTQQGSVMFPSPSG